MQHWEKVENSLPAYTNLQEKSKLAYKIKIITIIVMTLSLGRYILNYIRNAQILNKNFIVEHILNIISIVFFSNECNPNATDPIQDYFRAEQSQVFAVTTYSPLKALIGKCINVITTFLWSYMDLFVMLVSMGLAERFRQINEDLFKFKGQVSTSRNK